jgi:hypothetical protein
MEIIKNDELPENVITPTIIQRALLEICVYGIVEKGSNPEESSVMELAKTLQAQIEKVGKQKNRVRILWHCKEGEKTKELIEDAKQWVINNTVCKYYVLVEQGKTFISESFVKDCLNTIKKFEEAQNKMLSMGVKYQRKTY